MTAVPKASVSDFALARFNMVECQLRPNQVTDSRLLAVLGEVPREIFVPSTLVGVAYLDENIPLISGRFLTQPMVFARLVQAARVQKTDHVLDMAPATGYSTLVLAALAGDVTAVEPDALLYQEAVNNAAEYAPDNAKILAGAPVEGCLVDAKFDVIHINGSVEFIPELLFNQLTEGGRLITVVRSHNKAAHTGDARLYTKTKGEISWVSLFDANVPLAPGFAAPRGFEF